MSSQTDPGVRGIDQSLANPAQLNKGLGTRLARALAPVLWGNAMTPNPSTPRTACGGR